MTIAALAPFRKQPVRPVDDDFSALYRQYHPQLIRYVTHHFGPRDADEITQEALTRALRSMERDRSEAETWAWLVRVARNVAHDLARSRRICEATDDDAVLANDLPDDAILPEPAALLDERRRLVRRALKSLPATQRRILVLYEVDELNCPAIARLVGSNEYAVRKALQRARSRFAAEIRALSGGTLGSVTFWLRGLRRRGAKLVPAASASTALCAVLGSVAVTVSVQPAPPMLLSPKVAPPVASSASEADIGRVRTDLAAKVDRASRSGRAGGPATPEQPPAEKKPDIKLPKTPFSGGSDPTRYQVAVDLPTGHRFETYVNHDPGDDSGPLCDLPRRGPVEVRCTADE